ncbi:MAG: transposase [Bacteroidales bacterium]|nr:transposase [Bacteroidales bacterium]
MDATIKEKYLIWTAVGLAICIISLGVTIVVGSDFGHDNFIRLIVFLCSNVFGWLLYLVFQSFIFDAYHIYKMKFGKKDKPQEIEAVAPEEVIVQVAEETVVAEEIAIKEPIQELQPLEIHISSQQHLERKASYEEMQKQEMEQRERNIMEYIHYIMPRIADEETINHICTEVHHWMYNPNYKPKPIKRRLTKQITSVPLRHLVWNITARFLNPKLYSGDNKAIFIKTLFPKEFAGTEIETIKNFKVDPRKSEIPIDEPEGDNFSFHYPEDYTPKQLS